MKKIIYFLFVVAQFSAYSQIEISKVTTIRGANFYSGLKDNVNNTYISLRIFPSLKDSFFIDNNFISLSTGKIDTINNSGERGVVIVKIDSSYQDIKYHQFYGKGPDVDVSELFLASDNCIYFTIRSYDTVNIEKIPYYYKSKHGFTLLMKYNINSDSINIIKTIIGGTYSFFKEFNGKLYYAQKFYDSLIIDKLTFATSNTASDWDNILFCLDIKSYSIQKYYHFTGNDEESIHDFFVDRDNSLYVIGSFYGSSIIFNSALLKNSSSRSYDGFFFKIDSSNNVLVKKGIQGPYHQFPRTLDIGSNGQIYIYGNYNAQYIQVDQEKLFNNTKSYNIFSLHLDPSGSVQSLNQYNTSEYISAQSFIQHPTNKDLIFATGDYNDTLYVGNNNYLYTPNDNSDGVLLLMDKNCNPVDGFAISSNEIDAIQAITYNGLDNYTLWCYSREGSDTTKLINFDKKYLIKPGYFFMDVKIKKTVNTNEIPKNVYQFEVFPNPCIDYFTIKSNEEFKNVQITIYDMYGKIVYQEKFKKFVNSTSIKWPDNIVSGVYFIKLQASIVQQSMKIQKQ